MLAQFLEFLVHVHFFQHVFADEFVEIAQHFDADGMGEEAQRLFGFEAECFGKFLAIMRERVEQFRAPDVSQPPPPFAARIERNEMRFDGQFVRREHIDALEVVAAEPAHLRERDGLI